MLALVLPFTEKVVGPSLTGTYPTDAFILSIKAGVVARGVPSRSNFMDCWEAGLLFVGFKQESLLVLDVTTFFSPVPLRKPSCFFSVFFLFGVAPQVLARAFVLALRVT